MTTPSPPPAGELPELPNEQGFEHWYVTNAFDYERNPLGSRECGIARKAWHAALAAIASKAPRREPFDFKSVSVETAAAMLRAGQMTEAGSYVCANLAGGYELLERLYCAMDQARVPAPQRESEDTRDAERLDWLEKQSRRTCGDYMNPPAVRLHFDHFWPEKTFEQPKSLREAIDAARTIDTDSQEAK